MLRAKLLGGECARFEPTAPNLFGLFNVHKDVVQVPSPTHLNSGIYKMSNSDLTQLPTLTFL